MSDSMPDSSDATTASQQPHPKSPPPGAHVDDPAVTFSWQGPDKASNYELQIARDSRFDDLLFEGRVGEEDAFTFNGLPAQEGITLYWRVRAEVAGEWTDYSSSSDFTVVDWRADPVPFEQDESPSGRTPVTEGTQSRSGPILVMVAVAISIGVIIVTAYTMQGVGAEVAEDPAPADTAAAEEVDLNEYGVVDEEAGVYRIPIDQAINLVVQERRGSLDTTMQRLPIPRPTIDEPGGSTSQ